MPRRTSWTPVLRGLFGLLVGITPIHAQTLPTGTITGRITDERSGTPLPGAQLFTDANRDRVARSDANGRFRLGDVPAGSRTLTVRMIGYATRSATVSLTAGQTEILANPRTRDGEPYTRAQVGTFIPLAFEMDAFTYDQAARTAVIRHDMNRVLVTNRTSPFVLPFH
jgi:hypothetical protein